MKLWSAGSNAQGQLGTGDQEDVHQFTPALFEVNGSPQSLAPGDVTQIACGANHTLVLVHSRSNGSVSLWGAGDGSKGQLGISLDVGKNTLHFTPLVIMKEIYPIAKITTVQASWETSFVVLRSSTHDRILSFGSNDFGLLGTGDTTSAPVKDLLSVNEVCLDHLFSQPTTSLRVAHLKAGPRHVLAVLQYTIAEADAPQEMLIGWGAARNGQLEIRNPSEAISDKARSNGPRRVPLPIRITRWAAPVSVIDVSTGHQHALVALNNGSIVELGSNSKSQLPSWHGSQKESHTRVRCSWNNSFVALGGHGSCVLRSYGRNAHGQLGRSEAASNNEISLSPSFGIRDIICGSEHCLVTGSNNDSARIEVWGWGWNEHGNLALGHTEDVHTPCRIPTLGANEGGSEGESDRIVDVWAGCGTSWLATETINKGASP